jgi:hypothetical protein
MPITLKIEKPENYAAMFDEVRNDAVKCGRITFEGDTQSGSGSGYGFSGSYTVDDDFIEICISKKPLFVGKNLIVKTIEKYCEELTGRCSHGET